MSLQNELTKSVKPNRPSPPVLSVNSNPTENPETPRYILLLLIIEK